MAIQLRSIQEIHRFVDNLMDVDDHNLPDLKKIFKNLNKLLLT